MTPPRPLDIIIPRPIMGGLTPPRPLIVTATRPLLPPRPPLVTTVVPASLGGAGARAGVGLMCSSTIWMSESTRLMVMLLGRLISGSGTALLIEMPCKQFTGVYGVSETFQALPSED